ncbi:TonB-dependent receptor [Cellulophaga sp. BC115SP]|uniref:TonB-dependent receptor n=1 Tax=Cellulophaga sp. BC115SP TaxID=2683263 RepID=UPI001412967A|nr:TonB-dependent receptor [Cellulophaga sp. BC115SP]NBB30981.1 TonB-dependent receptor [Cellulophaga sp. BC115SP]
MQTKRSFQQLIFTLVLSLFGFLSQAQKTGSFKGKVIEKSTKQPIIGANIRINNTSLGASTDADGVFTINNIPAGSYLVTVSIIGFQTKELTDINVTSSKTYYTEIELLEDVTNLSEVVVKVFKGEVNPLTPVSTFSLNREEIFRNPGAGGDIMRALSILPGVVSSGSQFSAIAARGQGTQDNVYMVDDIPMFNLSHLEAEGFNSGFNDPNGGRFSIFAPRIIDNVQFQNGGFDVTNGRKASSYLGLGIKEGNKETWSFVGQFDLLGATLVADGPISKKTSLFSTARYQNLAPTVNMTGTGNFGAVYFGDYLLKTTTDLNSKNKLSFIAMYNPERAYRTIDDVDADTDINGDNSPGNNLFNNTGSKTMIGLNLRTLVSSTSYWKNVLYFRASNTDNKFGRFTPSLNNEGMIIDPKSGYYVSNLRNIINNQQEIGYRSIYTKKYKKASFTVGVDAMLVDLEYRRILSNTDTMFVYRSNDVRPNPAQRYQIITPDSFNANFENSAINGAAYASLSWNVSDKFTLNPGLRYDYFGFSEHSTISPRISGSYAFNEKQSLNFAAGIYYQDLGYSDIASQDPNNKLKPEETIQAILGYKYQFSPDLKLVVESWTKRFYALVVQPNRFQGTFNNDGTGNAFGADITLVKRLTNKINGQVGYSFMESKRDDNNGQGEYDYTFSVPHTLNALISYKPNNKWLFSGKYRYSTGRPTDAYIVHEDVLNNPNKLRYSQEITAINGDRLADYMALDIRIDYYKQMKKGLFSAFLDLGNVSGRFNEATKLFVPQTGKVFNIGLGVFPTFGVRFEL